MSELLKEAIADAKAVRETALQNAKMALEEAFAPQLKSILSAKLKEEDGEEEAEEMMDELEDEAEEGMEEEEGEEPAVPAADAEVEDDDDDDDEDDDDEGGEEADEGYDEDEEAGVEEDEVEADEGDDLDLESVIKELEDELASDEEVEEDEEAEETVEETIVVNGKTYKLSEEEGGSGEVPADDSEIGEDEEEGGGSEVEEDDTEYEVEETEDGMDELEEVQSELKEYKEAVKFLKDKLHEVNILNAKLLFTNKLFKEYALDNNQKLNVVETFDRAQTTREIKLVYSTLAEQFGSNGSINKRKSITESASSKSGSTKPSKASRKVISEEDAVANRFKKLAGIVKG